MSAYDADNLPKTGAEFSEEEKQIEAICDEERYLELHTDLAEQAVYEEEEWKRYYESLSEGYKAVGFSYDFNYGDSYPTEQDIQVKMEEEEVFIAPEELQVPVDMIQPETVKQNAIIEKTATFIAKHGVQMEIMMKTKQSNNSQFQFLHFDDLLNPYYKHVVNMIKSGKYKPKLSARGEAENGDSEDDHHDGLGTDGLHGYLHPSLVTSTAQPTPEVYKPITVQMPKVSIHDTPYGQLVKSFTKHHRKAEEQRLEKEGQEQSSLPPFVAQPVYGPSTHSRHGTEPGTIPSNAQDKERGTDGTSKYSSPQDSPLAIVPPPPDVQPIIDRMAMYVAKNGIEFEIVVKSKNDPRFEFLLPHHVHYNYYDFKKNIFLKEMGKDKPKETEKVQEKEIEKETEKEIEEKSSASKGVSFSIKSKPKEQESVPMEKKKRPIFDNESSDEESRGEGESHKGEGKNKSDVSGTSTPIGTDMDPRAEVKPEAVEKPELPPEVLERKIAEQRLKDRLAAAAREKLSQTDKEKQLQAERKKKAAMFINMLKSTNQQLGQGSGEQGMDIFDASNSTPNLSRSSSPLIFEDVELELRIEEDSAESKKTTLHHGSVSELRSKSRSRSRSPGHKRSKKKKKRSFTPPNAYAVVRRTPPHPPRYDDIRWRDRSPISNRDRDSYYIKSRSPLRSSLKSKKSKHSKLESSSKASLIPESPQKSSRKSKKKKKHRSSSRSHTRSPPILTRIEPIFESQESVIEVPDYSVPNLTPEAVHKKQSASSSPLPQVIEEGEIADSEESLLVDDGNEDEEEDWRRKGPDLLTWAQRADSPRDISESPSVSRDDENNSQKGNTSPISPEMMKKVRAMIKASRQTVLQEEEILDVS
ncbi:hypothetical protein ACJMK2_011217 [Sinanodonta woodiana]